jgi:hypothetical protein
VDAQRLSRRDALILVNRSKSSPTARSCVARTVVILSLRCWPYSSLWSDAAIYRGATVRTTIIPFLMVATSASPLLDSSCCPGSITRQAAQN